MVNGAPSAAPGHGNFPGGKFSPTIFEAALINYNRTASIVDSITNTQYEGSISKHGDKVTIWKEPEISSFDYVRGQELPIQYMSDDTLDLNINQARAFNVALDRVEERLTHIDWISMIQDGGGYSLTNNYDSNVLQYMFDNASDLSGATLGVSGTPITVGFGSGETRPLEVLNTLATALDENDVPRDGKRFFVASPAFYNKLRSEDSSLISAQVMGDALSEIRNQKFGLGSDAMLHGFKMYMTNNNPVSANSDVTVMAGHVNATSTAQALLNVELIEKDPRTFNKYIRGLHVFGRLVTKPENLLRGFVAY